MFRIISDFDKRLVRLWVGAGLYNEQAAEAFHCDLLTVGERFRSAKLPFDVLADLTQSPVQTPASTTRIAATMQSLRELGMRRSANVVASTLKKLQMERAASDQNFRFFTNEEDAEAWLDQ